MEMTEDISDNISDETKTIHENSIPIIKNLVLSGGSVRGISHIGVIKKLIMEKILDPDQLTTVAGTSAGSLVGLLIVLGFNIDEIWDFVYCLDMKKIVQPDVFNLLKKCGADTGQTIYNLLEEILTQKTKIKHINFKQLYDLTKIHFIVVGSCLTTKQAVYYDYINTPTFKVSMAIRISISMPGIFTPVIIGNNRYVDGGIMNNYPMDLFHDKLDETIGILICNEFNTDYRYPEEYLMAVMNLFMYHYYQKIENKYNDNTIHVVKHNDNINIFNFNIDNDVKMSLYHCGLHAAEEFIRKKYGRKIFEDDF